jgi:hypothetical protein
MSKGMGVLLGYLGGNASSVDAWTASVGKTITDLRIEDNELRFTFDDGSRMKLFDNGQSCCETRWMHTDDDLPYYIGAALIGAEIRPGGTKEGEYGDETESEFLIVTTSKGMFTVVNYNEHNGYYGGFLIEAAAIEQKASE